MILSGFLERMSVLGAVDSVDGGMSSGTTRRCSQGEALLGVSCCLSSEFLMRRDTCSDLGVGQKLSTVVLRWDFFSFV